MGRGQKLGHSPLLSACPGSGPGTFPAIAGAWGRGGEPSHGWEIGASGAGTCGLWALLPPGQTPRHGNLERREGKGLPASWGLL